MTDSVLSTNRNTFWSAGKLICIFYFFPPKPIFFGSVCCLHGFALPHNRYVYSNFSSDFFFFVEFCVEVWNWTFLIHVQFYEKWTCKKLWPSKKKRRQCNVKYAKIYIYRFVQTPPPPTIYQRLRDTYVIFHIYFLTLQRLPH